MPPQIMRINVLIFGILIVSWLDCYKIMLGKINVEACFLPEVTWKTCTIENNISLPYRESPKGFDFGWGSLDLTLEMCRNYGHIKAIRCMRKHAKNLCTGVQQYVLLHALDVDSYQKAAEYLCDSANIQVFYNQMSCLLNNERKAEDCSRQKGKGLNQAMKDIEIAINNVSMARSLNSEQKLQRYVEETLVKYACKSQKLALRCIDDKLNQDNKCNEAIIKVIIKYFEYLMPKVNDFHCSYNRIVDRQQYSQSESIVDPPIYQKSQTQSIGKSLVGKDSLSPVFSEKSSSGKNKGSNLNMHNLRTLVIGISLLLLAWNLQKRMEVFFS